MPASAPEQRGRRLESVPPGGENGTPPGRSPVSARRKAATSGSWGGGALCRSLLEAGQVHRIEIGLVPALIGEGIPFIPPGPRIYPPALEKSEATPAGIILATYRVLAPSR